MLGACVFFFSVLPSLPTVSTSFSFGGFSFIGHSPVTPVPSLGSHTGIVMPLPLGAQRT